MFNSIEKNFLQAGVTEDKDDSDVKINRRQFLKLAGAAAVLSSVTKVNEVAAGVGRIVDGDGKLISKDNHTDDMKIDISKQIIAKVENPGVNIEVQPEYQRNLSKLLLAIPDDCKEAEFDVLYGDLIANLPHYTEVEIFAKQEQASFIKGKIKDVKGNVITRENDSKIEMWAQDYGEAIKVNGQEKILVSKEIDRNNHISLSGNAERSLLRKEMVVDFFGEKNIEKADFFFEGGNMTFDVGDNGLRVFIGYQDLFIERGNSNGMDYREIAEKISRQFGGAEVVVMGDSRQVAPLVHIDQSFIILDNKTAVVNQFDDPDGDASADFKKIKRQHEYYRSQLEYLGYKIIPLKNSYADAINCLTSVNAVPFVEKNTGKKKIIFPVFEGEVAGDINKVKIINHAMLRGKALRAYEAYSEAGYEPIPVRDVIPHIYHGNIHCMTNVLANVDRSSVDVSASV